MAKLKRTVKKEAEIPAEVSTTPETDEVSGSKYINELEQEHLAQQSEEDAAEAKKVSTRKMDRAVEVAQSTFNLSEGSFALNSFTDKGSKCSLLLCNPDFDLAITFKDTEKFNIV